MSKRNGLNLTPIDFNTGIHLNAERDEFGLTRYWAVIEGDEITLLPDQYEALMNLCYDERKAERERIIKLIRDRVAGAKEYGKTGRITAMQRDVTFEDLEAIAEAIIYGINKESK